ncbi:MAG TPA: OsmC family protein [Vicinamibacterales bacterium]|jgi:organic hydroperoxide reductase OsmC/OhrA|nr:OsmC family protein [Vicinamibacterales bacterium]
MTPLPHRYFVTATGSHDGDVALDTPQVATLRSASPAEFGGPGNRWSPETLLVAAVADCFLLTFRAVAEASGLPWASLQCEVEGTLDRIERALQFTRFDLRAHLEVPAGVDVELARRVLEKSERACLVSNSLKAASHLQSSIRVGSTDSQLALSCS